MSGIESWLQSGLAWFLFGAVLLVIELASPGVLAIFFAAGAWVTAILLWTGIIHGTALPIAVFIVVSVLSLLFLRKRLAPVIGGATASGGDSERALDEFIGKSARVVETIDAAQHTGLVDYHGSNWIARADARIEAGAVVEIVRRENLTLTVRERK